MRRGDTAIALPRLFVVGCPRSGTTLLQSILATHPRVASFPETHFFPRLRIYNRFGMGLTDLDSVRSHLRPLLQELDAEELLRHLPHRLPLASGVVKGFAQILDDLATRQVADTWLEKTPRHLHFIDTIDRFLPHPHHYFHIVRSGPDVVASMYEATQEYPHLWGGKRSVEKCLDRWCADVELTRNWAGRRGHSVIFYSDLIEAPERVMRGACDAVGLNYDSRMVKAFGESSEGLLREDETVSHKTNHSTTIQDTRGVKFAQVLSAEEQQRILTRAAEVDLDALRSHTL